MATPLSLSDLQRIRRWLVAHRRDHPLEYHLWDAVLTLWMMGWVGLPPALTLDAIWALPLCLVATWLPTLYVRWRTRAHLSHRLRCDWL